MSIAVTVCALTLAGHVSVAAAAGSQAAPPPAQTQQTQPPPTQTPPPPAQNPPAGQKPPVTQAPATTKPAPAPVPFPPDAKIGFVDMQRLVNESKLGKQGQDEMKKLREKLGAPITAKQKEIVALQDKLTSQQNLVAENVLDGMKRDLGRMQRDLQQMQENLQAEGEQLQADLIANFSSKVQPLVEAIRNERGLWAVWVPTQDSGLYAVHPGLDLTPEVLKRLDATYK